jgi:DNA replication and repair protein RecF
LSSIKKITLVQFRNYSSRSFVFEAPVTCITGANGCGKTNLLDGVYYLCYTKSYFTAYQQNCVQMGLDGFRVEGVFNNQLKSEVISCKWQQGKKELQADGVDYEKPTDHIGKYAAVMIAPDDLELVNDGSEPRRKWVDSILSQTDKSYLECLMRYQRILQQRNAWLKQYANSAMPDYTTLEYYDAQLAADGTYIYEKRNEFVAIFLPQLQDLYSQLTDGKEAVRITYQSDLQQQPLIILLKDGLQHDMRLQRTLRGIHKDDLQLLLNNTPVKAFGSQGQKKSFLFAMKLAQYKYLSGVLGYKPILLLDDVFEKLDQSRMEALLRIIRGEDFGQVILTDTHAERVRNAFGDGVEVGMIVL